MEHTALRVLLLISKVGTITVVEVHEIKRNKVGQSATYKHLFLEYLMPVLKVYLHCKISAKFYLNSGKIKQDQSGDMN